MMRAGLETDIEQVFERFADLTQKEMNKAVRKAISDAAKELVKDTKTNLRSSIVKRGRSKGLYNDKIEDAVMRSKITGDFGEEIEGKVHIMGTQKKYSGTYRARFLEKGTKDRFQKYIHGKPLKKPKYTGKVQAKWFFRRANDSLVSKIERIYTNSLNAAIDKINNSKV